MPCRVGFIQVAKGYENDLYSIFGMTEKRLCDMTRDELQAVAAFYPDIDGVKVVFRQWGDETTDHLPEQYLYQKIWPRKG